MSSFPPIYLRGPFSASDNVVSDINGPRTYLWGAKEYRTDNMAQVRVDSVPTLGFEDTLLSSFQSRQKFAIGGTATGQRLAELSSTPDSPRLALMEWITKFESLCTELQGRGYYYNDDLLERVYNPVTFDEEEDDEEGAVLVETCSWTYNQGTPFSVEWDIEMFTGTGVEDSQATDRDEYIDEWTQDWLDEENNTYRSLYDDSFIYEDAGSDSLLLPLGSVDQLRVEYEVEFDTFELVDSDPSDNLIVPASGAVSRVNVSGTVSRKHFGSTGSKDGLLRFCNQPQLEWLGTNKEIKIRDSFMDREYTGQLKNFNTTWNSEKHEVVEYNIELSRGDIII